MSGIGFTSMVARTWNDYLPCITDSLANSWVKLRLWKNALKRSKAAKKFR